MIELLLQAERALSMGMVDQAEGLYRQAAAADPRNSIAVVGLARVALERADDAEAWRQARRALVIDPENAAAQRLVERLEEVWRYRGQPLPDEGTPRNADEAEPLAGVPAASAAVSDPSPAAPVTGAPPPAPAPVQSGQASAPPPPTSAKPRRGVVDRLLGRDRP